MLQALKEITVSRDHLGDKVDALGRQIEEERAKAAQELEKVRILVANTMA